MRVRIRFVLVLTLIVALILLASFLIIYSIYSHNRKDDFDKRLWAHGYNNYLRYFKINEEDTTLQSKITYYLPGALVNFQCEIIDSSYKVLYTDPAGNTPKTDSNFLQKLATAKEIYVSNNDTQTVGLFLTKNGHSIYVIASGYDKFGLSRLHSLRNTMIIVWLGSIVAIGLFALFYVFFITKPLVDISIQMRKISETNLKQRVDVGKGNARHNEIVRIASNFNKMLDRLEKAFNMQKNFVHHASHDLRTPLATMLSQTESALRRELTPEEARKVLESLKEDQQGMIELTNSLLLLSQYENINYTSSWPSIRLDEIMYDSIASMQKMYAGINISFDFLVPPENESYLFIQGNEVLLRSAFQNLLKNAIKYSDDYMIAVTAEAYADKIILHFENKGQVMKPDEAEKMFFPFFRGENAHNKKGVGLGLSIVKRIVELHHCQISYRVINGNTNQFTLTFFK